MGSKGPRGVAQKNEKRQGRGSWSCLSRWKTQETRFDSIRFDSCVEGERREERERPQGRWQSWDEVEEARKRKKKRLGSG